jgi:hypothetical protein
MVMDFFQKYICEKFCGSRISSSVILDSVSLANVVWYKRKETETGFVV